MKDYLKHLTEEDYDAYFFLPHESLRDAITIQGNVFNDPGTKIDGSSSGDCYHILLFKQDEEGNPIHLDLFDGILTAPLEYMDRLIPDDWFGIICRKTTTSNKFIQDTFDNIKSM
jgi:hypothetical protein